MISELIEKCRSYRRFDESRPISYEMLLKFIYSASIVPSGSNLQPLKYKIVNDKADNEELFKHLKWAGFLKDWSGPAAGERPVSYIIIFGDHEISKNFSVDLGISAYALMLCAAEEGIGSCMVGSVNRDAVKGYFETPDRLELLLVIAFGYPSEKVVLERAIAGNIRYYRDSESVHHVPKRELDDILIV